MADADIRRSTFPASCAIAGMAANISAALFAFFRSEAFDVALAANVFMLPCTGAVKRQALFLPRRQNMRFARLKQATFASSDRRAEMTILFNFIQKFAYLFNQCRAARAIFSISNRS